MKVYVKYKVISFDKQTKASLIFFLIIKFQVKCRYIPVT